MFFAWVVSWKCHFPIKQKISQNYQKTYSNALSITREVLGKYQLTSTLRGQNTFAWKHPPITDSVRSDPVGFFPSLGKNSASPVHGENLILPGFPGVTLTYPACIISICVKKATWQKGGGKFAHPVAFFPKTRWGHRCHWVCYRGMFEIHSMFCFNNIWANFLVQCTLRRFSKPSKTDFAIIGPKRRLLILLNSYHSSLYCWLYLRKIKWQHVQSVLVENENVHHFQRSFRVKNMWRSFKATR